MAKASKAPLDEWEQLCKTILALVETSQGGIPLDIIDRDYEDMTGSTIPWQLYGFSSLEELLSATGTVAVVPKEIAEYAGLDKMNEVRGSCDRSLVVVPVKNPKTEHLQRLISKQRPSVVTRLGGVVPNSVQWSKEEREREMRQKMQQLKMDPSLMKRSLAIVAPMATINIVDDGPRANRPVDPSTSRQQQQQQVQPPRLQQPVERQLVASQQPLDHQLLSSQQPAQQQPLHHQLVATQQPVRRQLAESQQPAQWQLFQPVASQQPIQGRLFQPDVSQQPVRLQLAQQVATQQPVRRQLAASQQPAQRQLVLTRQPMPSISYPIEKRESPPPPVPVATFDRPESPLIRGVIS
uniref:HTH OST-type domain-containing protein n=1 Tax=Plectus sambesii TaxID=2011161 RepID=A0A914WDK9_9BILA